MNNKLYGMIKISDKFYISIFSFMAFFLFSYSQGAVHSLIFISSTMIHELSHIFFLNLYKAPIKSVTIFPFGIDIICDTRSLSYKKELVCTLSGSLANLIFSFFAYFILMLHPSPLILFFILCNLFLGILNLIPVSFFDGGKALRLLLYDCLELDRAFYIHRSLDVFSALMLIIFAVFLVMLSDFNISVCVVMIYASFSSIIQNLRHSTKMP